MQEVQICTYPALREQVGRPCVRPGGVTRAGALSSLKCKLALVLAVLGACLGCAGNALAYDGGQVISQSVTSPARLDVDFDTTVSMKDILLMIEVTSCSSSSDFSTSPTVYILRGQGVTLGGSWNSGNEAGTSNRAATQNGFGLTANVAARGVTANTCYIFNGFATYGARHFHLSLPSTGTGTHTVNVWLTGDASDQFTGTMGIDQTGTANDVDCASGCSGGGSVTISGTPTVKLSQSGTDNDVDSAVSNFPSMQTVTGTVGINQTGTANDVDCSSGCAAGSGGLTTTEHQYLGASTWGVWAIVGLLFILIAAPRWFSAFRVTRGS